MTYIDPYESPQPTPRDEESLTEHDATGLVNRLHWSHGVLVVVGVALAAATNANVRYALEFRQFWPELGWELVLVVATGINIAGLLFALGQQMQRRKQFPTQYGHWLLTIGGTMWVVQTSYELLTLNQTESFGQTNSHLVAILALMYLAGSLVHWLAVRSLRGNFPAQLNLLATILVIYLTSIYPLLGDNMPQWNVVTGPLMLLISVSLMLAAFWRDLIHRKELDVFNWIGWGAHLSVLTVHLVPLLIFIYDWIGR